MKTVFKTYTQKQAHNKRVELQTKTGLKWEFYNTGNGIMFRVVVTNKTSLSDKLALELLPHLTTQYQAFKELANLANMSLKDVLIAAKTLSQNRQAIGSRCRSGGFYAIRKKYLWEK